MPGLLSYDVNLNMKEVGESSTNPADTQYFSAIKIPLPSSEFQIAPDSDDILLQNSEADGEIHIYGQASTGLVIDKDGDVSPDSPGTRWCGYDSFEWAGMATSIVRVKPGGTAASNGDLTTVDTGLQVEIYLYDSYAGGVKRLLHDYDTLSGDVTGTISATVVGNDSHNHSNSTLSGVPGAGIDTSAIHSGDSAGGDLSGTYPTPSVAKIQGNSVESGTPTARDHLIYSSGSGSWVKEEHYWNTVLSGTLSNASSLTLGSTYIAGDTQEIIRIHLWGWWNCNSGDRHMYLRLNSDTGSNYGSYTHYHGYESGVGEHHSSVTNAYGSPGSSSQFGYNSWSRNCDFTCTITIYPAREYSNSRMRQIRSEFMWNDDDGSDVTGLQEETMITWTNVSSELTNIELFFNGNGTASVYGQYYVEALRRKTA